MLEEQPLAKLDNAANTKPESAASSALYHASYNDMRTTAPKSSKPEQSGQSGELKFDTIAGYDAPKASSGVSKLDSGSSKTADITSARPPEAPVASPAGAAGAESSAGKTDGVQAHKSEGQSPLSDPNKGDAWNIRSNFATRNKHAADFGPKEGSDNVTPPSADKQSDKLAEKVADKSTEKQSAEKQAAEKQAAEKQAAEKHATEKPGEKSSEKPPEKQDKPIVPKPQEQRPGASGSFGGASQSGFGAAINGIQQGPGSA